MAKQRLKPKLTREEVNNQYVNSIFEEFIAEKKALGREADTLKAYQVTFKEFNKYFGERAEETGDIVASMFIEWTNDMKDRGLRPATINHHLMGMRTFMYWCMDEERQYIDRFKIRLVKVQEEMPKDYTLEEVKALLKKPDSKEKKISVWRSWAVSCFVVGTGARLGTLVDIRIKDLDFQNGKVFYQHTKNKKLQTANMPPKLMRALKDYIAIWRSDAGEEDYLFCNASGEKIAKQALTQGFREYTKSRGVSKTTLHGLRHTFAREWFLNGGDVVQLSKVLGHSTLAMSEHYMNIYADTARDRFIEFNPLENIARSTTRKTLRPKGD